MKKGTGKKRVAILATSQLITYQQIIGLANEQMDQFATNMDEFSKDQPNQKARVSENFAKEIINELQPRVEANNKILGEIENELYARIQNDCPGSTTPNMIGKYFKKYHEELKIQKKLNEDIAASIQKGELTTEKPVVKPNFKMDE